MQVVSSLSAALPLPPHPPNPVLLRTGPDFSVMSTAADGVQSRISGVKDSWGGRLGVESLAETKRGGGNGTKNSVWFGCQPSWSVQAACLLRQPASSVVQWVSRHRGAPPLPSMAKSLADTRILGAETVHSKGSGTVQAQCGYCSSKATVEVQQKPTERKWYVLLRLSLRLREVL